MKGTVILSPFSNTDVGSEDIESSDKGTSAEGTFTSYHPCPKEVLQRCVKPWKLRGWGSHRDSTSLTMILDKSIGSGSRFHFSVSSVIKSSSTPASRLISSLPSLGEAYRDGQRPWVGWRGLELSLLPSCLPLGTLFKLWGNPVVQKTLPEKRRQHGAVWNVELFGFGEDWLFGKKGFSF